MGGTPFEPFWAVIFQKKLFGTQISTNYAKGFTLIWHNYTLYRNNFLNNFCNGWDTF